MRSIRLLAVLTVTLLWASACSDGSGLQNSPPTAGFAHNCNAADCTFTNTSSDAAPGTIVTYAWNFGDGAITDVKDPSHSYTVTVPTDFTVTLTVTDNDGATDVETQTITASPGNPAPTAGFSHTCNAADCSFTSTSSDVAPGTIATYAWTFGDGGTSNEANPVHGYTVTAPTDFTVTLTVTDNGGAVDVETQTISVSPVNTPPTAGFTFACNGTNCSFTSTSTDLAPGTITTFAWNFGDAGTANVPNPQHLYVVTAPRSFTVTLTVTDNEGATDTETQSVSVAPPVAGAEGCFNKTIGNPARAVVDCAFNVPARSTMKVTILGLNCANVPGGQRVVAPPPIGDQMFLNVCTLAVGASIGIFGGPLDELIVYEAGSQVVIRFFQGFADGHGALYPNPPSATFEGTYPDWIMHFEDGSQPGEPGEPDFADVVIGLHATPR